MMRSGAERVVYALCAVLFALTILVLYAPMLVSLLLSIVPRNLGRLDWAASSLAAYHDLLADGDLMMSLYYSVLVAVVASVVASVVSVVLAVYLDSRWAIGRRMIESLIYMPFVMPAMITGLALLIYFSGFSIKMNLGTVMVGHTIFVLAIVYRLVSVRLANLAPSLREASQDLGADGWQTFRYVIFPHLKPSIFAGMLFAAAISIDETLITLFLSGDQMTLPIRLWSMLRVGFTQQVYALVTIVILGTVLVALLGIRNLRSGGKLEF